METVGIIWGAAITVLVLWQSFKKETVDEYQLSGIKRRLWMLENPPKYKIGQKFRVCGGDKTVYKISGYGVYQNSCGAGEYYVRSYYRESLGMIPGVEEDRIIPVK